MDTRKAVWLTGIGAGVGIGIALYRRFLRPWHQRWGATDAEVQAPLPGDEMVPDSRSTATHAITIHAPVEDVWQWIVQIGQDKGGFYSYTWLENMVGCHMHNANRILPDFQKLEVGDRVRLHPSVPPLPVLLVEPERTLVLGNNTRDPGVWGFHLKRLDSATTRLVIRGRGDWNPGLLNGFTHYVVFEPAHFVMERKMMLGIKARAEGKEPCCKHKDMRVPLPR